MEQLEALGRRFWAWRARQQPRTRDDIPRLVRPDGWLPDIGAATFDRRRDQAQDFATELAGLAPREVADRVDHRLLAAAVARVHWELDVNPVWNQPQFYVDQSLGPVFDVLLRPGIDADRTAEVTRLLRNVPAVVAAAVEILGNATTAEFARLSAAELDDVETRLGALSGALADHAGDRAALEHATAGAAEALGHLRDWLTGAAGSMAPAEPIGSEAFRWFLREVACVPLSPAAIRELGSREADRAVVAEALERRRTPGLDVLQPSPDVAGQCATEATMELAVRAFYEARELLSQPVGLGHYLFAPMPPWLEPLRFLGVTDDLTGPDRLHEDGIAYIPAQAGQHYFYAANARDPRAGIVHEGAHYQQLALSWAQSRPIRRHYYDSCANEGIAFYNEEMTLAAGLFDDAPRTRVTIWNFLRLRAIRAVIDVDLGTGRLGLAAAAAMLQRQVPMDGPTALEEATSFAQTPGQALSYLVGKSQLVALVAEALRRHPDWSLRRVHDSVWRNGNVPIALQRWELLGLTDELDAIATDPG